MVIKRALALFDEKIPGRFYETPESKIPKTTIISVFKWIVRQTKGFKVPVIVNFRYREAPVIGMFFSKNLGTEFANKLYDLNMAGIQVPTFGTGWHNGPDSPYIIFSNLFRDRGIQGKSLDGVKVINIHGRNNGCGRKVSLKDILS